MLKKLSRYKCTSGHQRLSEYALLCSSLPENVLRFEIDEIFAESFLATTLCWSVFVDSKSSGSERIAILSLFFQKPTKISTYPKLSKIARFHSPVMFSHSPQPLPEGRSRAKNISKSETATMAISYKTYMLARN